MSLHTISVNTEAALRKIRIGVYKMRLALLALIAAISTGSCSRDMSRVDVQGSNSSSSQDGVTFEIRNFSWTESKPLLTSWQYTGHAFVVTKEPSLQQGTALVDLQYRASPPSTSGTEEWSDAGAQITDGSGDVTLSIFYDKTRYKENPGPPKLEWRVQGFLRFSPAKVIVGQ